ncbi:hypothetical protein L218DRAFT_954632 [Marasmius fiardii PR-910]|nr:hypothetical protein L218DRAFT_954632 [Marasmius fiardii PR-910]
MHTGCAKILRSVFNLENDESLKEMTDLFQIEDVLGPVMEGRIDHGRFRDVRYENVGEKIDLCPFWTRGQYIGKGHDEVVFDFKKHTNAGFRWMFTRPDIFPKFDRVIDHSKRVAPLLTSKQEPPSSGTDILTSQPLDVILVLLPYLDVPTYLNFISTCKYFRYHAITTFQPHAPTLLLEHFPFAFPTKLEYALMKKKKEMKGLVVSSDGEVCSPTDCDWLLYMGKVHWTKSMRVRRYIWSVCVDVKRAYDQRMKDEGGCGFCAVSDSEPTERRKALEQCAQTMIMMKKIRELQMGRMKKGTPKSAGEK